MPSKTPKPYCSVLLTRWTCASFQSTIVPSIQILSAFSIRLPDHLLAASRSTIVWPPIATYAVNIDCPRPAGCTAWWAREDSNLQPDRYERSALTIELRARCVRTQAAPLAPHTMPRRERQSRPARAADAQENGRRSLRASRPLSGSSYILKSRLALPLKILVLSSLHSGTLSIHCTAGLLATKGQSTANRIRSMPISMTQHNSAGLEKLPLVVMWKWPQKASRKLIVFAPGRAS